MKKTLYTALAIWAVAGQLWAQISPEKREVFIQKATSLRAENKFTEAAGTLDSILLKQPKDAQILLFKGDLLLQAKKYKEAVLTYQRLLPLNYEPTQSRINLSYALFMDKKAGDALQQAKAAWQGDSLSKNATVNYFNAMLWNAKTSQAAQYFNSQQSKLPRPDKLILQARLQTTAGNYKSGLAYYDTVSKQFTDKNYVKEYAEVLIAKGMVPQAKSLLERNTNLYNNTEKKEFNQKLKLLQRQNLGLLVNLFKDIGSNIRFTHEYWYQMADVRKYPLKIGAGLGTFTAKTSPTVRSKFATIQLKENWSPAWKGETEFRFMQIDPEVQAGYNAYTGKQSIKYQPHDRRMLTLVYGRDILNFTPELFKQNISQNNLGYVTHLMTGSKTGIYSQGMHGWYSDANSKNEIFASLYHIVRFFPIIKTGLNHTYLSFAKQSPFYFAPNRYSNTEAFAELSGKTETKWPLSYMVQIAGGMQKIEQRPAEFAKRLQAELSTNYKSFLGSIKYQTSNVASGNGTGYKFDWFTLGVSYWWP